MTHATRYTLGVVLASVALATPWLPAQTIHDVTLPPYNADTNPNTAGDIDGAAIRSAIAAANPGDIIRFPAGDYEVEADTTTSGANLSHLFLDNLDDLTFEVDPVDPLGSATIHFRDRARHAFRMVDCSDITIRGLTLKYEKRMHLEGTITAYTSSPPTYTIQLDTESQQLLGDPFIFGTQFMRWQLQAYQPVTRRHKDFSSQMIGEPLLDIGGGFVTLKMVNPDSTVNPTAMNITLDDPANGVTGDLATVHAEVVTSAASIAAGKRSAYILRSQGSTNTHIEDVTILNGFIVSQHESEEDIEYLRCKVIGDPGVNAPLGALISTVRDGVRFINNRQGPVVKDCVFERLGDDPINIHSHWLKIESIGMFNRVHLTNLAAATRPVDVRENDTLVVHDAATYEFLGTHTVSPTPPAPLPTFPPGGGIEVTLTTAMPSSYVGHYVTVTQAQAPSFEISGNTMRETRARGILARGHNAKVLNNTIAGTQSGGIVLSPETEFFQEAGFSPNLEVSGNTIHVSNYKRWAAGDTQTSLGSLSVSTGHDQSTWPIGRPQANVTIRDNWISDGRLAGLFLGSVEGVVIENNRFIACQLVPSTTAGSIRGIDSGTANGMIHLQNGLGVLRDSNLIDTQPFLLGVPPVSNPSTSNGVPISNDIQEGPNGDNTLVYGTSFELEEVWTPAPPLLAPTPPPFSGIYNNSGAWEALINGVHFRFDDWGLFGNHHKFHFYRGWVGSRCQQAGGTMEVDLPGTIHAPLNLKFFAAANTPGSGGDPWTLHVEAMTTQGVWNAPLLSIPSSQLPYPPTFAEFDVALPTPLINLRFRREGGSGDTPYLYVDDVVVHLDV